MAPWAQSFQPTRPVEIVVHNAAGGGSDVLARYMNTLFDKHKLLPVRAQVNNRPGGGSATAMAYMAEKKGEPHTIALYTSAWIVTPMLAEEVRVGVHDMTLIAQLVKESSLVLVKADAPYKTLKDFIEAAKREPGKLKQAGGSVQTRGNFLRLILQKSTGAQWSYISFPGGGERLAALLGGHVQLLIAEPQEVGEHLRRGSLRVIAQVAEKRLAGFPDVPTLHEAGFPVWSAPTVRGVAAPGGYSARGPYLLGRCFRAHGEVAGMAEVSRRQSVRGCFSAQRRNSALDEGIRRAHARRSERGGVEDLPLRRSERARAGHVNWRCRAKKPPADTAGG